jgi:hypothetical protein
MSLKRYPGTRNPINQIDKKDFGSKNGIFFERISMAR